MQNLFWYYWASPQIALLYITLQNVKDARTSNLHEYIELDRAQHIEDLTDDDMFH